MHCYKHSECGSSAYFWAFYQNAILPLCWGHGKTIEAMGHRVRQIGKKR